MHTPPPAGTARTHPARWLRPAALIAGLALAGVMAQHVPGLQHLLADPRHLRASPWGAVGLVAGGALYCALGLPRQVLCLAAGVAFGVPEGFALATVATVGGGCLGFAWARWVARAWVRRRFGATIARLDRFVAAGPFLSVLMLRLMPVGSALMVNVVGGISGIGLAPFALATILGSAPQTAVFVLLGAGTRLGHGGQIALAVGLFAVSGVLGVWLMRRYNTRDEGTTR